MYNKALQILQIIENNGFKAYIVGGYARDLYLGRKSADVDICTNAKPKDLKTIFKNSVISKEKYGSVTLKYKNINFEITTFRKEIKYKNNRLPVEIKYINELKDDLLRRDFIINTLCIDKNGTLIDTLDAKKDLDNRIIRTVGVSYDKLEEDSLRILRAIRFATILNFELSDDLKESIKRNAYLLKELSYYRKKEELDKIFSNINVKYGVDLLIELDLIESLEIPNLKKAVITSNSIGIWSQLNVVDKYVFTNNEKELIKKINEIKNNEITNYSLYINGLYLSSIVAEIKGLNKKEIAKRYMNLDIKNLKDIVIDGNDIASILNIKPSKLIKEIQIDLENKILNKELLNDRDILLSYVKEKYNNN
ncbi:MAG TPA: hypothetical protein PLV83_01340 [Bacilli bacterium]|nr:hypothetical protein [Bacilli bacterium]